METGTTWEELKVLLESVGCVFDMRTLTWTLDSSVLATECSVPEWITTEIL